MLRLEHDTAFRHQKRKRHVGRIRIFIGAFRYQRIIHITDMYDQIQFSKGPEIISVRISVSVKILVMTQNRMLDHCRNRYVILHHLKAKRRMSSDQFDLLRCQRTFLVYDTDIHTLFSDIVHQSGCRRLFQLFLCKTQLDAKLCRIHRHIDTVLKCRVIISCQCCHIRKIINMCQKIIDKRSRYEHTSVIVFSFRHIVDIFNGLPRQCLLHMNIRRQLIIDVDSRNLHLLQPVGIFIGDPDIAIEHTVSVSAINC